ncbi:MAG: (2Fe-2S)-binding protein [Thermoplasmata archaeon]|nr:MAG: (2Fe-2S)-binding protein [Thermoplasmata archaeon]
MINLRIDGLDVQAEDGWTILETCQFYGIDIPTLCYDHGLSPYGACRLCLVEIGEGKNAKLVSSCTYPALEGLKVKSHSNRIIKARKIVIELMIARCPNSKTLQDLASKYNVQKIRFKIKHEDCLLCGLCVRMCKEQMMSGAIDFIGRGKDRRITTAFDEKSDLCRTCGGCMYICPICELRCQGPDPPGAVCGSCLEMSPTCLDFSSEAQCFMVESGCGTCVRNPIKKNVNEMEE